MSVTQTRGVGAAGDAALRCGIVGDHRVIELTAVQTHPLRLDVLRRGTPSRDVAFPEDELPSTLHLGVELDGVVVGVSTWIDNVASRSARQRAAPSCAGWRPHRSCRVTASAGCSSRPGSRGCSRPDTNWSGPAPATRRSAFYERHGFVRRGPGYVDVVTLIPHHDIVRTR